MGAVVALLDLVEGCRLTAVPCLAVPAMAPAWLPPALAPGEVNRGMLGFFIKAAAAIEK
jgi:hypothetical protein